MIEARYFPLFEHAPDDDYVAGWLEHAQASGYPELYDMVSSTRPNNLADVRLLSGEVRVKTVLREGQTMAPCPLCQPNSPKFLIGRLAHFPHDQTVQFIGHDCAAKHIGEDFRIAEQVFRDERRARKYQHFWKDLQARVPGLAGLLDQLAPMVAAIDAAKSALSKDAAGFDEFLLGELSYQGGKVSTLVDTGLKDNRGNRISETVSLGTVVGLQFLEKAKYGSKLRDAQKTLREISDDLPAWNASDENPAALEELLRLGDKGFAIIKLITGLVEKVSDSRLFLHENNLAVMERWSAAHDSPFHRLSFRRKGAWIFLDSITYAGDHRASFRISDDMFAALPQNGALLSPINLDGLA